MSAQTELLKRCAAVRHFDAALLDVLGAAPPAVEGVRLADLIAAGAVEPVPGRPERFRVPDLERRDLYARWWAGEDAAVPEGLRAVSEAVLTCLVVRRGDVVEELYHELIVAPSAALARFEAAFAAADAHDDLARCQDLLDVVIERLPLLGPEGEAVCDEHQRRLRARALWLRDWRRSARFQRPATSVAAIEALLRGDARVLELCADGGMGKSSHLRWLIARRCVPEGIACARVDLEAIDPLRACREPWLVLLHVADQLDRQLPDAPFATLLAQHPDRRERLLRRPPSAPSPEAAVDVPARFAAALGAVDGERPIVIALDTLEAAPEPELLLATLAALLDAVPALRLVLAGRERPGVPGAATLRLRPFTDGEARAYLREKRGLDEASVIDRLVAHAGGVPLTLALLADLAEHDPDAVVADLATLLDRLLRPLDPDLRALLVYGSAPRVLEHDFAVAVIGPLLPGRDVDALWRALRHYASHASWVQLDALDAHVVRLHPSTLAPMRTLLAATGRSAELRERAIAWFVARSRADPANAGRWLEEAAFHRLPLTAEPAATGSQAH